MPIGECKLCLKTKELQDSHYLPKGAYKINRAPALKNPNPVVLSGDEAKQVSAQIKDYLLCSDCEQRFSEKGERWVLSQIPRDYGAPFPLCDRLNSETPIVADGGMRLYAGADIKGLGIDNFVYFAMSVFWRGAVHKWKAVQGGEPPEIFLDGFEEPIRQFLLHDKPLPKDIALTVFVCPNGSVLNALLMPWEANLDECSRYLFYVSGVGFVLHFCKALPFQFRKQCAYHSPQKVLVVSSEFENVIRKVLRSQLEDCDDSKLTGLLREIANVRNPPND